MPRVGRWAGAHSAAPRQNREAQEEAAIGPPFLWILSFGGAKDKSAGSGFGANPKGKTHGWVLQSISPSGAKTRLKNLAIATHYLFF
jgi:hypothetical protein